MRRLISGLMTFVVSLWIGAYAATDGGLGNLTKGGSRGTFDISLTLGSVARVFGLKDLKVTLGQLSPTASFCIYTNAEKFTITATSGNQKFELQNSSKTAAASYSLELYGGAAPSGSALKRWDMQGAGKSDPLSKRALASGDNEILAKCSTGNFSVKANVTLKSGVKPDEYRDTVTFLVEPQ